MCNGWVPGYLFCKLALQIWGKLSWIYYRLIQDLLPLHIEGKIMHVDDTGIDWREMLHETGCLSDSLALLSCTDLVLFWPQSDSTSERKNVFIGSPSNYLTYILLSPDNNLTHNFGPGNNLTVWVHHKKYMHLLKKEHIKFPIHKIRQVLESEFHG